MAGVIGVVGELRALQQCDLAVDSLSIGSGEGGRGMLAGDWHRTGACYACAG